MSELSNDPFLFQRQSAAELMLIRHGDAIPGPEEIIPSGIYDDLPLSQKGREQARAVAERLKNMRFDAAYSSPLRRCQETAAPLIEQSKLPLTIVEGIKEVTLSEIVPMPTVKEGDNLAVLTKALQARQVEIIRGAGSTGSWDTLPGSESSKAFRKRVVDSIDEIASSHIGQRVVLFTHGGVINAYAAEVLGLDKEFFFPSANTSLTLVHVAGTRRVLYFLNDIAHLRLGE
jgi:2,3-bisphosphoglycerate-dependent phosphoglycerate mutase